MFVFFFLVTPTFSRVLLRELLENNTYNPVDSPFDIYGEQLVISIEATYVVLAYVEENRQIVSYILNIEYVREKVWLDPRLRFDVNETEVPYAILPANLVWIPTVDCYNCIMVEKMDSETEANEVRINPNGTAKIIQKARFDTICRTEIAAFPFDVQYCGIFFDAGLADLDRVRLLPRRVFYDVLGTPEWQVKFDGSYMNNSMGYSVAYISFKLTRNSVFYVIFLILPTMIVTSVSLAAILLPIEMSSGEKVNMGITGMLGLTFLLSIIVDEVPRSERLPVLGQWVIVEMFICIVTLVVDEPVKVVSYIFNIEYVWMDRRLEFDMNETGIEYAILPSNLVWIPTVDCYNCLMVENMDMETQFNEVRKARYDTICRTEIAAFPFDIQYCGVYFGAGMADLDRVRLLPRRIFYDDVWGTPEWQIKFDGSYYNNSYGYSIAFISFKLTRNSEFYTVFLILPTMVVSSVSLAAILLPLEMTSGEKINMGITGMLGLTFLLSIIVVEVPRSQRLPVLGKWVIVEMFICILTLVVDEPVKAVKKRIRKKLDQHRIWLTVLDYVLFGVIFFGNILFTTLIFTILPKNNKEIMF